MHQPNLPTPTNLGIQSLRLIFSQHWLFFFLKHGFCYSKIPPAIWYMFTRLVQLHVCPLISTTLHLLSHLQCSRRQYSTGNILEHKNIVPGLTVWLMAGLESFVLASCTIRYMWGLCTFTSYTTNSAAAELMTQHGWTHLETHSVFLLAKESCHFHSELDFWPGV